MKLPVVCKCGFGFMTDILKFFISPWKWGWRNEKQNISKDWSKRCEAWGRSLTGLICRNPRTGIAIDDCCQNIQVKKNKQKQSKKERK